MGTVKLVAWGCRHSFTWSGDSYRVFIRSGDWRDMDIHPPGLVTPKGMQRFIHLIWQVIQGCRHSPDLTGDLGMQAFVHLIWWLLIHLIWTLKVIAVFALCFQCLCLCLLRWLAPYHQWDAARWPCWPATLTWTCRRTEMTLLWNARPVPLQNMVTIMGFVCTT